MGLKITEKKLLQICAQNYINAVFKKLDHFKKELHKTYPLIKAMTSVENWQNNSTSAD